MIRASDFIPDALQIDDRRLFHDGYLAQDRLAFKTGQQVTDTLKGILGWKTVIFGMNAFRLPGWASAAVSLLGWSCHFTEFLLYPLVEDANERFRLARLGGLANLISNLYDHMLDHHPRRLSFGPETLSALLQAEDPLSEVTRPKNSTERLLTGLIAVYLSWLNEYLPGASNAPVRGFILKAIQRMYEEENRIRLPQVDTADRQRRSLMIRDGYPFLVMGAPAWAHETSAQRRRDHFFMLYAVGRSIGLLDDALDMAQDQARSKENLWILSEKTPPDKLQYERLICRRVTDEIQRTMSRWESLNQNHAASQAAKHLNTFRHTLYSWTTLDAVNRNHRI